MAALGLCSRREADEWISKGWVRVNGYVAELGLQVTENDKIEVDRGALHQQGLQVTLILHKPVGYVSGQAEDGARGEKHRQNNVGEAAFAEQLVR